MTDKHCLCHGLELARQVVELTDNPYKGKPLKAAEKLYQHLLDEADKPENSEIKRKLEKRFEEMRTEILNDSFVEPPRTPGIISYDRIRDAIHHSPELKNLLVCGSSFEDKQELKNVIGVLEVSWNIMAESGDTLSALQPLDDLAKHYECDRL